MKDDKDSNEEVVCTYRNGGPGIQISGTHVQANSFSASMLNKVDSKRASQSISIKKLKKDA